MKREELEKEARNFASVYAHEYAIDDNFDSVYQASKEAYLAGAEPREKQIQIDAEQIRTLQKQNGELTDKVIELEGDLELWESGACRKTNLDKCGVVKELKAQIEEMKCCENCGWYYLQQHWKESKEINESRMFHCGTCGNKKNWKLRR